MYKNEYTNKRGKRESVTPKSQCERQDKRKVKKNKYDFKEICEAAVHYGFCYCYLCGQPIESWQDMEHRPYTSGIAWWNNCARKFASCSL